MKMTISTCSTCWSSARIPLLAAERDNRYPLILVGGAVTYINPEPLCDFVDLMVIGDGEDVTNTYLDLVSDTIDQPRSEHLQQGGSNSRDLCTKPSPPSR